MSGHGQGHEAANHNKGVALLISILALMLAFSELGGNNAEREAQAYNLEASNLWAFFQAKTIRRTTLQVAAEQIETQLFSVTDPAQRDAMQKRMNEWKRTADRYESEPETGEGRKELAARAKVAETQRNTNKWRNEIFEISSAILQIAIVMSSAMIITGIAALAWVAGGMGVVASGLMVVAMVAPELIRVVIP